ncbi:MAG: hypothetical protein BM555_02135 [Crocinitomix sp. MedPE-SWsnd]|nr:MAG: hypothetical protein BM555_02135 [Crocinitomix sp. MedPE-SWsnd]
MRLFGLLICSLFVGTTYSQDTITVQTFTYDTISTRRAIFTFPTELQGETFEKVLMYYNIKCDPLTPWDSYNCGEWDYLAHSRIYDHTGVMDSNLVEGPQYLVNNDWPTNVEYVTSPYYDYYEKYQKFITYTAEADNDWTIGAGTDNSAMPFGSSAKNQRTQVLWTAAEIAGAGITAGSIDKLRFDVNTLGGDLEDLTIKLKHTTATEVTSFDEVGWTTVYELNTSFGGTGIMTLNLTYPFAYDGVSDLLMDITFENATANTDNVLTASQTTNNSVIFTNERLGYLDVPQNDFVEIGMSDYDFGDQITISFWANGDANILPVNTSIFEAEDSLNNRILNAHFPWSNSQHYWDAGEGSGYDRINQAATIGEIEGEWHHWAFTKDKTSGKMKIFLDGVEWLSGTDKDRAVGVVNAFKIGINRAEGNGWPGKIDEFRVWDVELAESDIAAWMNQKIDGTHPNYADLVLYYDFDGEGAVVDKSGNDVDGMMSTPGMVKFYEESMAGYEVSDIRPNVTFVQGTYTSSLDSTLVLDSVMVDQIDITEFQVDGRKFVIADIMHQWPSGYGYTYDHLGVKTDSVFHADDVTIPNDSISYYEEPFEIIDPYEIGRFITPYGINFDLGPNGFTYVYDISDYEQFLMGDVDFAAHNTQELIDVKFKFIKGTPPREVIKVEKIWGNHGSHSYADLDNDVKLPAKDIDLDPAGSMFKVRSRITGHGHNGSNNCCEWGNGQGREHEFLVDGTLRHSWEIWQSTECGDNPNISQGGTWPYAREGWCPGDIVEDHEFDITEWVTPGTTASLDYDIEDVPVGDPAQGNGNYNMAMHLITYGAPNFANDAAIVDVLNPNNWEYYGKWNPTCQNPRVVLRNTGSNDLTSVFIHIWVGGFANTVSYEWTGNLGFLEEEIVEIPINDGWWYDSQNTLEFSAMIHLPNGVDDEYEPNNTYTVPFEATPVYNEPFYLWFKTNNMAHENALYVKDGSGNIVFERTSLTNATEYKDTLDLAPGCYTVEITDSDHDGISFWYANQTEGEGSGFLRLRKVSGGTLHTFDPDFGRYANHSFTVGFALENEEIDVDYGMEVFPNPSEGIFNVTLDNFRGDQVAFRVYDEAGALAFEKLVNDNNVEGYIQQQLDLAHLADGIYMIQVMSDEQIVTKRIVKK